jgi:hypothetical protein
MYDIKVAVSGGFAVVHSHSDVVEVVGRTVDEDADASQIAFMDGHEPCTVYDYLTKRNRLPRAPAYEGKIRVIIARIVNEYGMPAAVVCDSEVYVVNAAGKTVITERT